MNPIRAAPNPRAPASRHPTAQHTLDAGRSRQQSTAAERDTLPMSGRLAADLPPGTPCNRRCDQNSTADQPQPILVV